jgi:HEAT repeat protein
MLSFRSSRALPPLLAILGFLLVATTAAAAQNDDIVRDFKKYYAKFKDAPSRREAVLSLKGVEGPEVVETLVPLLKEPEPVIVDAIIEVLAGFTSEDSKTALGLALEKAGSAEQKAGLLQAARNGKYKLPIKTLGAFLGDKDWGIRRYAVQALAVCYPEAADGTPELLAPLCRDGEPAVRAEAIERLTAFKSPLVVAPAIALLGDSVWQVRLAAIRAMRQVRRTESVAPLVARMQVEEGRLVEEIALALRNLTGREFGMDPPMWKQFLAEEGQGYQIPTEAGLQFLLGKRDLSTGKSTWKVENAQVGAVFGGIETTSRSIIFIIDQSGSMEAEVVNRERYKDGGYPSMMRIDIVKTELQRTIERLEPNVNFNILAFATELNQWKKNLVAANLINKTAAKEWIGRLEAIGGNSKSDLVEAGLGGAANISAGKTNTYGALMWSLNAMGPRTKDPFSKNYQIAADTVFFLSDGRPTVGDFVEPDDILREFLEANELRQVVLHTLAIGEFEKDFMKSLAEKSGGVFVDLGH